MSSFHPFVCVGCWSAAQESGMYSNRADYSFIPGELPGIRIVKPDFPENRDDYPFCGAKRIRYRFGGQLYLFGECGRSSIKQ